MGYPKPHDYRRCYTNMDAGFKSASKYDRPQPEVDEEAWALAGEWTIEHFQPFCGGSKILPLDITISELERTTSAGYPWNRKYKNKGELLDSPIGKPLIEDYHNQIKSGILKMVPIWTVSEKVELRHLDKLRENKIRTFTASPTEFSAVANTYCLDFNNKFYASANKSWSFVGATPFQQGWDRLYNRLDKHKNAFELDESTYDCSLFRKAMYGQRDIRYELFCVEDKTKQNYDELTRVYDQIVNSVMVLENGELVRKDTGNPSGSINTIVDNTMILYRLFAYAWIILCKKYAPHLMLNRKVFEDNVEAALNGDDNTYTCSDLVVGWFNPISIGEIWSSIGVVTTTPCSEPRKLSDVSFLSHKFVKNNELGIYWPEPETQRILCSLAYNSKYDDVRWHYLRACALRICSFPNLECRTIVQNYIEYLQANFQDQLVGAINDIPIKDILGLWRSDKSIEAMYSGYESLNGGAQKNFCTVLKEIPIIADIFVLV